MKAPPSAEAHRPEQQAADKRHRLLQAARAVLAERGYEKTSVSEIVRRAGVAQGTFYHYFSAKSDLLDAFSQEIQEAMLTELMTHVSLDMSMSDFLSIMIQRALAIAHSYQDILDIIAPSTLIALDSSFAGFKEANMHPLLQPMLEARKLNGELDSTLDTAVAVRLLDGVMQRMAHDVLIKKIDIAKEHYIAQTVAFTCRALGVKN